VLEKLKEKKLENIIVMSTEQIKFIQELMTQLIGRVNLDESWWGKADVKRVPPVSLCKINPLHYISFGFFFNHNGGINHVFYTLSNIQRT
jgi:hypothetical protein